MTFYEKAQQLKQLETEFWEHVPAYLQQFDDMLLHAPLARLAYDGLDTNFRARLQQYFKKELNRWSSFPEYQDCFVVHGSVDMVDYGEMTINCEEWHGDSCDTWRVPILTQTQLEELQQVAFDIVSSINDHYHARRAESEDKATKARRKQYEELRKEFGDD